jgi:polyisoprenoid-binding protein YceI
MRILVGIVAAVAVVAIAAFLYLTRGVASPTQSVQSVIPTLAATEKSGSDSQTVFHISQADSKAEYDVGEVLNGQPNPVVGTTNQVAGDILIDLTHPAQSQIGKIAINARTFATDESRRDNMVVRFVLQSESSANQFITFQPTSISGLPTSVAVGDTVNLQVAGDLTIAGTTKPVTFTVTAALATADQLTGHAEATIQRADFGLNIPNVPFVASVD